jgi:hypothetical protein
MLSSGSRSARLSAAKQIAVLMIEGGQACVICSARWYRRRASRQLYPFQMIQQWIPLHLDVIPA